MLKDIQYFNCDLPSIQRRLEDPELFFQGLPHRARIVLDEIHRLKDPAITLKIAADVFPDLRILATGSSTLAATKKFKDTLTGRKQVIYLPPALWSECVSTFHINDFDHRLLHGGLPEPLLSKKKDPDFFAEWMDSYYARDIQELFGIRERTGFLTLLRFMLYRSGSETDYTMLSRETGLSRPTIKAHLEAMDIACALYTVTPFHGGNRREIVRRPKIYAFDTGFVTHVRGWDTIREEDRGILWEHLVLDTLRSCEKIFKIQYWRDKSGREIDFILPGSRGEVDAIECKINPDRFHPGSLRAFRSFYPKGKNYVICPLGDISYERRYDDLLVRVGSVDTLCQAYDFGSDNSLGQ